MQKTLIVDELIKDKVNRSSRFYFDISGKGINVSRVLSQLDEPVIHLTHLGGCFKSFFINQAQKENIPLEYIETDTEIRFAVTVVDSRNQTSTELVEEGLPVMQKTEDKIRKKFTGLLSQAHTVILSGTTAPGYSSSVFAWMTEQAKEEGIPVIGDFRGGALLAAMHFSPDVIKPNYAEFIKTFLPEYGGREKEAVTALKEKMEELYNAYHSKQIITDGNGPIRCFDDSGYFEIKPQEIAPANTIGCGDSFTAGFASEYRKTGDFKKAVMKGEECARLNALSIRPGSIV